MLLIYASMYFFITSSAPERVSARIKSSIVGRPRGSTMSICFMHSQIVLMIAWCCGMSGGFGCFISKGWSCRLPVSTACRTAVRMLGSPSSTHEYRGMPVKISQMRTPMLCISACSGLYTGSSRPSWSNSSGPMYRNVPTKVLATVISPDNCLERGYPPSFT